VAPAGALVSAEALALRAAGGSGLVGDLQAHAAVVKVKASVKRVVHERMKPPMAKSLARSKRPRLPGAAVAI